MEVLSRFARATGMVLGALALAALLTALLAGPVFSADPTVRLQTAAGEDAAWILTAQVDDASGNPVGGANVDFSVQATFLGSDQTVAIGSAVTDTSGAATINYVPTWNGHQVLTATATGTSVVSAPAAIDVTGAAPVLPADPPTLGLLRTVTPPVVVFVVLGVWALLGGTFLYAVLGVARWRPRSKRRASVSVPALAAVERAGRGEVG